MRQALRGLEALHNAGYLHSDIKPANMMIDRLGIVKLIDYGRAVRVDEASTYLMGTPLYMAPEIHRQQGATVQSDIFSVGLVGMELLCNEPLVAMSALDEPKLLACKDRLVEILPNLLPEAVRQDEYLIEMFRKFLHRDPAQRYASAAEAESGPDGLNQFHKQLTLAGKDTEYDRELEKYVGKALGDVAPGAGRVEELIG
jgi:serine/threonine protein kinase